MQSLACSPSLLFLLASLGLKEHILIGICNLDAHGHTHYFFFFLSLGGSGMSNTRLPRSYSIFQLIWTKICLVLTQIKVSGFQSPKHNAKDETPFIKAYLRSNYCILGRLFNWLLLSFWMRNMSPAEGRQRLHSQLRCSWSPFAPPSGQNFTQTSVFSVTSHFYHPRTSMGLFSPVS